jgi:hypothetical protein
MYRKTIIIFLLLAVLLAACQGEAPTEPSEVPSVSATKVPTATPTAIPTEADKPEPTATTPPTATVFTGSECTLVSSISEPSAEYVSLFSPTEDDWIKGPETAAVTIVEYGDYQ